MAYKEDRPKYFTFPVSFKTEKEMEDFKSYVHGIKAGRGIPIYQIMTEMMELHKEKFQRRVKNGND